MKGWASLSPRYNVVIVVDAAGLVATPKIVFQNLLINGARALRLPARGSTTFVVRLPLMREDSATGGSAAAQGSC